MDMKVFRHGKNLIKFILLTFLGVFILFLSLKNNKKIVFLMEETRYETSIYYLNNSPKRRKVFIIGGIHGNEIAGIKACEKIIEENYPWGRMVIVPIANKEAYRLRVRNPYYMSDLNRAFPGRENGSDTEKLANEIFNIIKREKPDFVIDLHEWNNKYDEDTSILAKALIINSIDGRLWEVAQRVYNEYNKLDKKDKLVLNMGPPIGSINKEVSERLNIPVISVESNMENSLEDRIDFHLYIIENIIKNYEMD